MRQPPPPIRLLITSRLPASPLRTSLCLTPYPTCSAHTPCVLSVLTPAFADSIGLSIHMLPLSPSKDEPRRLDLITATDLPQEAGNRANDSRLSACWRRGEDSAGQQAGSLIVRLVLSATPGGHGEQRRRSWRARFGQRGRGGSGVSRGIEPSVTCPLGLAKGSLRAQSLVFCALKDPSATHIRLPAVQITHPSWQCGKPPLRLYRTIKRTFILIQG